MQKMIGKWTFIIGVIIAVIVGLLGDSLGIVYNILLSLLVLFGLVVGFLNIQGNVTKDFLFGAVVLIIAAWIGLLWLFK